jgi:Rab3 GTPase-activating protein catalytic subunit
VSPAPPVTVAVRFTYVLQEWAFNNWLQGPVDLDKPEEDNTATEFSQLPFGACEDPVR